MKNNVRLLTLALALLLLLSAVPFSALADEEVEPAAVHTHSYYLAGDAYEYDYVSNTHHRKTTYQVKTCSCGYSLRTRLDDSLEVHYAEIGSKTYLGTYIGENERAYDLYQLTCRHCGGTYQIKEWQEIID